ncbi:MAG: asparaginase, partial [bacterium]
MPDNPVLVEVYRGEQVESLHRGSVAAVNADGELVLSIGNPSKSIYPRSALKIFQAIPLIESGAADRFDVTPAEIALSCASHSAEDFHLRAVREWLARLDLGVDDLECGPDLPLMERVAHALIARGEAPTRAHQNCSGKHVGMLTLAKHLGVEMRGYSEYDHPTQRAWMQTLSELAEVDAFALPWERDGCGLPAVCMPLRNLARAFARYADVGGGDNNNSRRIFSDRQGAQRANEGAYANTQPNERGGAT